MKKRIFIAMHYMEIGGAESSLIGLLEALDPRMVNIDLFIFAHHGVFMSAIPNYVNLLPEDKGYAMMEEPLAMVFKKGHPLVGMARLLAKWKMNRFYKQNPSKKDHSAGFAYIGNEVGRVLHSLYNFGEYDLAISYNYPHNIVLDNVMAKKKIAWLHTDYRNISINEDLEFPIWRKYDQIVSISPGVTEGFLTVFPSLKDKILECENMLPKAYIETKATQASIDKEVDVLTLCSVGRISNAKNYDNIPNMAFELKELFKLHGSKIKYKDFKWVIVGPGDHSAIDAMSEKLGVRDNVVFMGPSDNPYPYIKGCDIYVHPSRYEGKSIVVREAQVLCKPVIITNYPTAKSQINNGVDGIICELNNKSVAEAIFALVIDPNRQSSIINYLKTHDYAGGAEVEKIYSIMGLNDNMEK